MGAMTVITYILLGIDMFVCVLLIAVTTLQTKESQNDAQDTMENPKYNKFFEKNKGRTKAGKMNKRTIILGIAFIVLSIISAIFVQLYL